MASSTLSSHPGLMSASVLTGIRPFHLFLFFSSLSHLEEIFFPTNWSPIYRQASKGRISESLFYQVFLNLCGESDFNAWLYVGHEPYHLLPKGCQYLNLLMLQPLNTHYEPLGPAAKAAACILCSFPFSSTGNLTQGLKHTRQMLQH